MNWNEASDLDINKRIAEIEGLEANESYPGALFVNHARFDPCKYADQAWPLILQYEIDINFFIDDKNDFGFGRNRQIVEVTAYADEYIRVRLPKEQALKAAMIWIILANEESPV